MKCALSGIVFLAIIASWTAANAEDMIPIFHGSFQVDLPDGVALSENQAAPVDEILQQLSIVDSKGRETFGGADAKFMRMSLLRELFVENVENLPRLSQRFTVAPDLENMTADRMAAAKMTSSFRFNYQGSNRVSRPLKLVRMNETWWRFDNELDVSVTVDLSVPTVEICKYILREAICIHRYLDQQLEWRKKLGLRMGDTTLSDESLEALTKMPYFQLPLTILQSVSPTASYRPCCKRLQ